MKKELTGGRKGQIFKSSNSVIRPINHWSNSVHDFLLFMDLQGVKNIPAPQCLSDAEERVSFVPGDVFNDPLPEMFFRDQMIISAAKLLLNFHEEGKAYLASLKGTESWMLSSDERIEVMCHGDFAPYNVTIIDRLAFGIIDFDTLHPGSMMEDIAYAVYRWCLMSKDNQEFEIDWNEKNRKTRLFMDTYGIGAKEREALPEAIIKRLQNLVLFMKGEAEKGNLTFKKNIEEGHVRQYLEDIDSINRHKKMIISALIR